MAASTDTRRTAQKEAVERALEESPGFVSAQELHKRLEAQGMRVGVATVYRRLGALAEAGLADTVPANGGGQLYRACEQPGEHHHHLICENCGKAVEIEPPSEEWIRAVARKHGYTVNRHELEVFGLCPDCA